MCVCACVCACAALTLVAEDSGPSCGAVAAAGPRAAAPPVGAVLTRQAAVMTEGLVQTH